MAGRRPIRRDTTILLVVTFAGLLIIGLVPPSGSPPAASAGSIPRHAAADPTPTQHAVSTPATTQHTASTPTSAQGTASTRSDGGRATDRRRTDSRSGGANAGTATPQSGSPRQTQTQQRVKLQNTRYAPYAYLISSKNLSSGAERALDGFRRNRTRINATTVRITLDPYDANYQRYSVLVRNDQKLYFIETSLGDDAPQRETGLRDDAPVKVDNYGYIIQ
ncbi:MAG: hypothetical protein ABEJ89_09010 [Haloarculaceae archaeon]